MQKIGLIGLGLMGSAIADRLLEFGYKPFLWNRTREKADSLIDRGAVWSDNPIADCDRVVLSLYSSDIVESVLDQFKSALQPRKILVDTTTGDPEDAIRLSKRLQNSGVHYLDAPISGSSEQTRRGEATVLVGGDKVTYEACADLWPILGKKCFYVGSAGSAAKMKLVSNLVLGLNRAALAEGLAFAESLGMPLSSTLEVLKESAAYSRVMDVKGGKMISGDFRTQAKLSQHLKDVRLINESARNHRLALPMSFQHQALLEQAELEGYGEDDNCSIFRIYVPQNHRKNHE